MPLLKKVFLTLWLPSISLISIITGSCATPTPDTPANKSEIQEQQNPAMGKDNDKDTHGKWFEGSMEQALEKAKQQNKILFVYWGAKWCPPCNEMKSTVFNQPVFWELVSTIIPVYLDGDSESAQIWGDKLNASGYPTLMFLSPEGKELSRVSSGISLTEFKEAFQNIVLTRLSLEQRIANVRAGKASPNDYRLLALIGWDQLEHLGWTPAQKLDNAKMIYDKTPTQLVYEKSVFAGQLLSLAQEAHEEKDPKIKSRIKNITKHVYPMMKLIFSGPQQELVNRGFIVYGVDDLFPWVMQTINNKDQRDEIEKMWLLAAERLSKSDQVSLDVKLWAVYPQLVIFKFHNPLKKDQKAEGSKTAASKSSLKKPEPPFPYPDVLVQEVIAAVEQADRLAKTEYERQAVMSGASALLDLVNEQKRADLLLDKEIKLSPTPYYYQSILAKRARDAGRFDEAIKWADAARISSEGRATKIQWIVGEISLILDLDDKQNRDEKVSELLNQYYTLAFKLSDGFAGRNAASSKRIATKLTTKAEGKSLLKKVVKLYRKQCDELIKGIEKGGPSPACADHFKLLAKY